MEYCSSLTCFQYAAPSSNFCAACRQTWWDPHLHVWTMEPSKEGLPKTLSGHDATVIGPTCDISPYDHTRYEADMDSAVGLRHTGGAFIEATSCCFGATPGSEIDYLMERDWVLNDLSHSSRVYVLVCGASLEAKDAADVLAKLSRSPIVRGIRQVVNYKPSWPRNDNTGNLLTNPDFIAGFELLAQYTLSFDLQLNPSQFFEAAELVSRHPNTPVIIDHLGTPTLEDLTLRADQFWSGLKALASCSNTFIKISMLCYIAVNWDEIPLIVDTVKKVIALFGPSRCMFASNYPVDGYNKNKWEAPRLLAAFSKLSSHLSVADQQELWQGTAHRAYQVV